MVMAASGWAWTVGLGSIGPEAPETEERFLEVPAEALVSSMKEHQKYFHLVDADGTRYLDLAAGIAVNVLGHSDPGWVEAVQRQAAQLCHVSNLYHTPQQATLAKKLCTTSFADRVFFCNSGAEANEGAIKFARKYARLQAGFDANYKPSALDDLLNRGPPTKFVSFERSFHGRTMGALALTYKENYKLPFAPLMGGGTESLPFGDLDAVRRCLSAGRVAAVFVEPVQGGPQGCRTRLCGSRRA